MSTTDLPAALAESIYLGDIERLRRLLADHPSSVHGSHGGHPWLQIAAGLGDLRIVELLIGLGADVNAAEDYATRLTALDAAVLRDRREIAELLLRAGADPNQGRQIIGAVACGSLEMVKLLEQHGADIHRVFINQQGKGQEPLNALSTAIAFGKADVAEYLRSRGAVPPVAPAPAASGPIVDPIREVADAVLAGDVGRTRRLLSDHPECIRGSQDGVPWLHLAARQRDASMVEALIQIGCDVHAECKYDHTALQYAGSAAVARRLLAHGADPNHGPIAMMVASRDNIHSLEMIRLLDEHGADLHFVYVPETSGREVYNNALKAAIEWGKHSRVSGKDDVVEYLRSRGAVMPGPGAPEPARPSGASDPDPIGSILADGIRSGNVDEVRRLLFEHPHLLAGGYRGHTWLRVAAHYEGVPMVELLLGLGSDVNAEGSNGFLALDAALGADHPEVVRCLLHHGANPNRGKSVLWAIVGHGRHSLEMLRLLEQYGADLDRPFVNEMSAEKRPITAIGAAKEWGKKDVARYLSSRKSAPAPARPPRAKLSVEVLSYFREQFGPVQEAALKEIVPTDPRIAIHVIPASAERRHITLFTIGMSDRPMTVPDGGEGYQHAELFVQLPADWPYARLEDPASAWPIHWLRSTAKYPHQNNTWLGGPVAIIANDDPPQPLATGTRFTSLLFLAEKSFVSRDGRTIRLYRMAPLYTEERDLEIREGIGALLRSFDARNVPFVVDLERPSVA